MQPDNMLYGDQNEPNQNSDTGQNVVGRDTHVHGDEVSGDKIEGDKITADNRGVAAGEVNNSNVVTGDSNSVSSVQHFGTTINLGPLKIPKPVAVLLLVGCAAAIILIGSIAFYSRGTFQAFTAVPTETPLPTATPLPFATQTVSETLIVVATFHNTAATNSEAHTKIRRAIAAEAANSNEQLRVEVEPTILTADQRTEAEALGNRYNASMVIWGEDTGVEVIVNFLNLREPDFKAANATIAEQERTQLANPDAYANFVTQDLPQTMGFFAFFAVGQSYYLNKQYGLAIERIEAAVTLAPFDATIEGLPDAYFRLGWLYQFSTPADLGQAIASYDKAIQLTLNDVFIYYNRGLAYKDQ
ncbi:MAG: tetratricopeptide repeat protein, partial [Caldilineaceae bacterium]|nr:tetratricopeptide repeat protein [Caldilineaceae bacterium]